MITLSGVIDASDLDSNFSEESANIEATNAALGAKDFLYELDVLDPVSSMSEELRVLYFTPPTDLEVRVVGLTMWNPDGTTRVVSMTLRAVAETPAGIEVVPKYTDGTDPDVEVTGSSNNEFSATRESFLSTSGEKLMLVGGVEYRLLISVDTATAVDRALGFVLCRSGALRV